MYQIKIENRLGDQLELTHNSNYTVTATGLNPVTSNIITASVANYGGERYVSSRQQKRNIVLTIYVSEPVEANRINLYKYIKSHDLIRLYYKNKSRNVYIDGYVESFELDHFSQTQTAQVSIICPQPNFIDMSTIETNNSNVTSGFYMPFNSVVNAGESDDNNLEIADLSKGAMRFTDFLATPDTKQNTMSGKNLIDFSACEDGKFISHATGATVIYSASYATDYIKVTPNKSYYFSGMKKLNGGNTGAMYDSNKNYVGEIRDDIDIQPLLIPDNVAYIRLSLWKSNYDDITKVQLEENDHATAYEPYCGARPTPNSDYPEAITGLGDMSALNTDELGGLGWSVGDLTNDIDSQPTLYKNMKSVDLGTLSWSYSNGKFYTQESIAKTPTSETDVTNCLCSIYTTTSPKSWYSLTDKCVSILGCGYGSDGRIGIVDSAYTDATAFKSAMSGVTLHYEATSGGSIYEARLYHKRVGRVDLGSLTWALNETSLIGRICFYCTIPNIKKGSSNEACALYECKQNRTLIDGNMQMGIGNNVDANYIVIRNDLYTDATAFKNAMSGQYLYYELATEGVQEVEMDNLYKVHLNFNSDEGAYEVIVGLGDQIDAPNLIRGGASLVANSNYIVTDVYTDGQSILTDEHNSILFE